MQVEVRLDKSKEWYFVWVSFAAILTGWTKTIKESSISENSWPSGSWELVFWVGASPGKSLLPGEICRSQRVTSLQSHCNPVFEKVYLFMLEETPHIRDSGVSQKRLVANYPGSHLLLGCGSWTQALPWPCAATFHGVCFKPCWCRGRGRVQEPCCYAMQISSLHSEWTLANSLL